LEVETKLGLHAEETLQVDRGRGSHFRS